MEEDKSFGADGGIFSAPENLSAIISALSGSGSGDLMNNVAKMLPAIMSAGSAAKEMPGDCRGNDRDALLRALRPYLSPERQRAIDYVIGLARAGEFIKSAGAKGVGDVHE